MESASSGPREEVGEPTQKLCQRGSQEDLGISMSSSSNSLYEAEPVEGELRLRRALPARTSVYARANVLGALFVAAVSLQQGRLLPALPARPPNPL